MNSASAIWVQKPSKSELPKNWKSDMANPTQIKKLMDTKILTIKLVPPILNAFK